jgi:hypothetical protein
MPKDVTDFNGYTGTLTGTSFSAVNNPVDTSSNLCHYVERTSLSGSFSPDFTRFTGTETWTDTLDSGQVTTVTLQFSAVRR